MNDPFVVQEATRWAERTLDEAGSSTEQRIEALYHTAFARPPTEDESPARSTFCRSNRCATAAAPTIRGSGPTCATC